MDQRELTPDKKDKGFTLVELLIVIVILGILATVVVFAVANVTEKASDNACATEKKVLITAIESYKAEHATQTLPASADLLIGPDPDGAGARVGESYLTDTWPSTRWTFEDPPAAVEDGECDS